MQNQETIRTEVEEFHEQCKPLVEYMHSHPKIFSIHSTVIITMDGAKLVTDEMITHYELPEGF